MFINCRKDKLQYIHAMTCTGTKRANSWINLTHIKSEIRDLMKEITPKQEYILYEMKPIYRDKKLEC